MAKIYGLVDPDDEAYDLLGRAIQQHHPDLAQHEVTVALYWASSTKQGEPALKHHGYPAAALIKINADVRLRLKGTADASITIDAAHWERLDTLQREALLDHELEHLQVAKSKHGNVKLDDAGRPKLRMAQHDFELGVFYAVVERYGRTCIDAQMLAHAGRRLEQLQLPLSAVG